MNLQQVLTALQNADAAGDTAAARELASLARSMGGGFAPPPKPSTERSFGEAVLDVPAAAVSGLGGLLQFPGQLVKLVPGLSGVGEVLEKPGELISEAGQALKSEGLKAREALRSKAISEADKDGILSSFATAITSTIKDPALITTFVAEQVPLLLGPLGAAKVAQKIGAKSIESAGVGLTGAAAEEAVKAAAQRVSRTAYGAAYGTGAAMQAADVSSDAYDEAFQRAKQMGMSDEQAQSLAANAGRVAGAGAGVTALLAQRIPGAKAIEQRLAGVPGTAGKLGAAVGESIGEAVEEGGGQVFKNIGLRQVTPDQPLLEGVGGAAGLGALGGGLIGGALGKKAPEERFEGQQEGESDRAFAARLQREIQQGIRPPGPPPEAEPAPEPPPAGPTLPGDQQLFTLAAQPNGYGLLENLKQKLIADQSIPEDQKKPVIDNIGSIQTRMNIEQVERLRPIGKPPAPLLPTDEEAQQKAMGMDLNNLGTIVENMNKSIPVYQGVLADPEVLKKEAKKGKLSVEEARSRYQEHIEYINSVLPVYTQVLQQRKQQQQQTKEAEKAQEIANLTPEQQAIRSQAESLIKELAESGVPEFVTSASGFQNVYNNNNFKTEKDIEFLKSKVESYRKLKQSAGAAKPVDEISLEFFNKDYPDDLARIQEASKDPRLADLFTRINDVMNRGAKAINALGMSWNGVDARSPLDIQEVKRSIGALGGGVGQLTKIKQAIDKNYDRSTNDPAKLERAITEIEADIETANQRIAKVQALAPAAPPSEPAAPPVFAAPPPEKVKKIEGPKPKGMPVRAKELPQPAAPVTQEQKEIKSKVAEIEKDIRKEEAKRRSVIYRSDSLFKFLKNKLNQTEVNDVSTERQFKPLVRKGKPGDSISTFVANGDLDPWLPPDRRLGMTNYDEYDNTEYIKDLLRGGKATDLTFDAKSEVERIYGSITALERSIKDLVSVVEANEAANTAREEQRAVAEETGPTAAEIESQDTEPSPIVDEEGRVVRKSLGEAKAEKVEIPPEIQKKIDLLEKVLRKNLAKFGLKDVDLNLEQGMSDEGSFSGQLIRIALDSPDPLGILRHESIHALKEAGFFTDKQWATLERTADEKWIDQFLKNREVEYEGQRMSRYDAYMKEYGGNTALIREEAIADAFRSFSKQKPAGLMGALTERMKNFFKAIKSAFNSQGFESAEDIFGKIEEGKLPAPPAKAIPAGERKSLRAPTTEAFKQWFGDSQVVDESGNPLVVYHGMPQEMEGGEFRRSTYGSLGEGIYFTDDPEAASRFATGVRGTAKQVRTGQVPLPRMQGMVLPVYLKIDQPFDDNFFVGNKDWQEWAASILRDGRKAEGDSWPLMTRWQIGTPYYTQKTIKSLHDKLMEGNATVSDLMFLGNSDSEAPWGKKIVDAIQKHGSFDGIILQNSPKGFDEYVVFKPNQVKSATGNIGTFEPTSPDIRKSLRATETKAFDDWFKGSKIVDNNGKPRVMYHGTAADFDEFKPGSYVTTDPDYAAMFGDRILPVYVSASKIKTILDEDFRMLAGRPKQIQKYIDAGFDALASDSGSGDLIILKPEQVKSAIGNVGTYNIYDKDIRKSLRTPADNIVDLTQRRTQQLREEFERENEDIKEMMQNRQRREDLRFLTEEASPFFKSVVNQVQLAREVYDLAPIVQTDIRPALYKYDRMWKNYMTAVYGDDSTMYGSPFEDKAQNSAFLAASNLRSEIKDADEFKSEIRTYLKDVTDYANGLSNRSPQQKEFKKELFDVLNRPVVQVKFSLRSIPVIDPDIEARINDTIQSRPREGLVDRMVDSISAKAFSYFREQLINHYNEFAEYDKRVAAEIKAAGGVEQMANEKAEVAALFSDQAAAVASSALGAHNRKGGVPVYRNGIVTVDTSGDNEGPVVIFAPLASTNNPETFRHYQFWAAVNRAGKYFGDTTATRYTERLFNEDDVKRAKKLYESYLDQGIDFKDIQKRWNKYNNGLVKLMRDTGSISEAAARDFMLHADYFPFYRQVNEEEMTGPKTFSTIAGTKPPKAAKGSEAPLGDFFETVVRNTQSAITLAMKNVAAQRATSQALRINEVMRLSENPQIVQTGANTWDVFDSQYTDTIDAANEAAALSAAQKTYGANVSVSESPTRPGKWNIFKPVKIGDVDGADVQEARQRAVEDYKYRASPFVYKVLENGQPVYYRAADIKFINALKALNTTDLPFIGLLSAPANALRTLVTKEPGYMLVNQMRDSLSAWVTSGVKLTPIVDSARQFAKSISKETPEMEALFNAGVIGGYEYAHGMRESGEFLEKQVRRKAGVKTAAESVTAPFTSLWGALERGTQISDGATRAEVYKRVLAETGNEAEALWQAAEVLNFYRHGRSPVIRVLTAAVPFLNSRIQGLDVLYRAGMRPAFDKLSTDEQRQRMKTFWVRGMTMMALSSMYWMLTHDDDEYKKQEQETRDNYWLIPSLGIKIAIPFEVGVIFKVLPERILENAFGSDTGKDTLESLKRQLESTLMFTIIPQAIAPYIEVTRNFSSFTQRPIIGQGMEDISPRFQVAPGTSSLAQLIANKLAIGTTEDSSSFTKALASSLEISPIKLDHMIKGYTGTIGQYAVEVFDAIYNLNNDVPKPSKRFEQMPIIKRLALDPDARGSVTAFYDLKNSVDEVVRTSNLLERTMKPDEYAQYLSQNMGVLAHRDYVLSLEKSMKEFREMKTLIRNSEMTGEEKRDLLLTITQVENDLTANIRQVRSLTSK